MRTKKFLALLLAVLMAAEMIPLSVFAKAGDRFILSENYIGYTFGSDLYITPLIKADDNTLNSGHVYGLQTHELRQNGVTVIWGFCLEPNATSDIGNTYEEAKAYAANYGNKIRRENPAMYKQMCRLVFLTDRMIRNGFGSYSNAQISGVGQIIIWEIMAGYRSLETGARTNAVLYNAVSSGDVAAFRAIYAELDSQLVQYADRSSFASATASEAASSSNVITLDYDTSSKEWSKTLTDSKGAWPKYLSAASGTVPGTRVNYTRNGNSITFTANSAISGVETSSAIFKTDTDVKDQLNFAVYGDTAVQGESRGNYAGQVIAADATADAVYQFLAFRIDAANVSVHKTSSNTASYYTSNPLYSLSGAAFGLYSSAADAGADKNRLETLTTDESGDASSDQSYAIGQTIFLKEIVAPRGYRLNNAVISLVVSADESENVFRVSDVPANDPEVIRLQKVNADGSVIPTGNASLQGAEFRLKYYAANSASGDAAWEGVFVSDANGLVLFDRGHLKDGFSIPYETTATGVICFPLGFVSITEVKAPAGYRINDTVVTGRIEQKTSGGDASFALTTNLVTQVSDGTILFPEDALCYSLTVTKTDTELLQVRAGAEYDIINRSSNPVLVNGKSYAPGAVVMHIGPTGPDGKATTGKTLPMGTYGIKETKAPAGLTLNTTEVSVIITNADVEKDFENDAQKGSIKIMKKLETAPSGYSIDPITLDGFQFRVQGTTILGTTYDKTFTTDATGTITISDLLVGSYKVTEVKNAKTNAFIIPEMQENDVTNGATATFTFTNVYKKFNFTLTKVDADGLERTEASLAGAEYTLYKGGVAIKVYTTDENGQFTSDDYICDSDWTVKETRPSEGYKLDETEYSVGAVEGTQTVEIRNEEIESKEKAVTGKIMINKVTDEGLEAVIVPEEGAKFEVFLAAAKSYDAAKETERDILTIDHFGVAITKELPYGIYTVHQIYSWDGRELNEDFNVVIDKDSNPDEPYYYSLKNDMFRSYIRVVKTDAETGETIPLAGATFEIYDANGELVTIQTAFRSEQTLTGFVTDETGTFITPIKLPYGEYTLKEIKAPEGYVLYTEPIPFIVNEENAQENEGMMLITVTVPNGPEKGQLTLTKEGEIFWSVEQDGDLYVPVYEVKPLAGATFEITAATDIYTPDGTLRAEKGEVVDTITTGEDGKATSVELYLGKYEVREIEAPYGMVLNEEVRTVEFTYGGQDVEVVFEQVSFTNDRQKFDLSILKEMKADEDGNIDLDAAIMNVEFSMYAREEMVAADGKTIPADGLLVTASPDEDGKISFEVDLPVDAKVYVKEAATDSHYILDEGEYDLTAEYAGQDKDAVELVFNDGDPVTNIPVEIKTTLFGTEDVSLDEDGKTVSAYETVTLIDRVEYTGLVVGKEYTVTGTLMDKATGESFKDEDGNEITAAETFTAETADGYVDVTFTFPGILVSEKTKLVAFEEMSETDTEKKVAVHTDIEDEDQTVTVEIPKIGTTAAIEGEKVACSTGKMTLTDIVAYENLVPGTYKLCTRVYDKTKGKLTDWTGETVFEVTEKDGTASVEIIISALDLTEDSSFVVFESLYRIIPAENEDEEDTEEHVTDHEDEEDEDQTVEILVPEIGTKATINDLKVVYANETMTLADVVAYKNLASGKYVLRAEVYDKNAQELTDWTGELEFTVTEKDGEVTVEIEIDASIIKEETSLVVFEHLFRLTDDEENPEEPVTEHEDEEDEDQTVTVEIPEVEVSKKAINGTDELPGATLIIKDKDGKEVEKWTSTDETHTVTLPVGEYTLTELTAPEGYLAAETISFKVSVNDKNEVQVSVLEDEEYVMQDGTLIVMFDRHEPMMHTTVSANGKVSTDEKHAEVIQASDKTTVAVKDTVYYEFFRGGSYLLKGKLVKVEKDGTLLIVKEVSTVVEAREYEAGEWVLDFGEIQLESGKYVVFEKATPVTVEEKENPEKPEEKIEEITPTGESISHENPEDESQTFVVTNVPPTGDSMKVVPYLLLLAVSGTGIVLLTKKRKTKA